MGEHTPGWFPGSRVHTTTELRDSAVLARVTWVRRQTAEQARKQRNAIIDAAKVGSGYTSGDTVYVQITDGLYAPPDSYLTGNILTLSIS